MTRIFVLLALFVLFAACGTVPKQHLVTHHTWEPLDPTKLTTYAWLPRKDSGDDRIDDDKLEKLVEGTVDAALERKGYERVKEDEEPRFVIGYLPILMLKRGTVERWSSDYATYYDSVYGGHFVPVYRREFEDARYEEGTLVLRFHDAKTHEALWESKLRIVFATDEKEEKARERVTAGIQEMIASFPSRTGTWPQRGQWQQEDRLD
ncbi:MAG: DUF4136 domain-containing protein [Planctomycetota bacterium]|jgi:hypothetical protein